MNTLIYGGRSLIDNGARKRRSFEKKRFKFLFIGNWKTFLAIEDKDQLSLLIFYGKLLLDQYPDMSIPIWQ